jgi:hypothetical protein
LQERLIVADGDHGAVKPGQRGLQHFDGRQVEVIGRLVQQQEERRLRPREHAGQSAAQVLAAAERARDLQRRASADPAGEECGRRGKAERIVRPL